MHTFSIAPTPATETGQLPGYTATCTCGHKLSTSLGEREARGLGAKHLEWHGKGGE